MKLFKLSVLFSVFLFSPFVFAQAGSVELRDGGGVLVSSHASIQEAYNAIPANITQAYTIEILAAYAGTNETFPITFSLRTGTSTSNTITLRPAAGNTGESISGTAGGQPILLLDDIDFVIIDGRPGGTGTTSDLTLENLATTISSYTIRLLNGACNNVIRYCVLRNNTMNTAGPRTIEIGTSASNPTGNSDNLIMNNEIIGGRSGIGLAGTTANPNQNTTITNNRIYNFGYAGIWVLSSSHNIVIQGNEIYQTTGFNTSNFGIIAAGFINLDIIKNKIYDIQNTASATLRGMQITPAAASVLNVFNNFVSLTLDNGTKTSLYGIQLLGSTDCTMNLYYNTIRIGGTHTGGTAGVVVSGGIVKGNTGAGSIYNQKNNVVLNTRTGGTAGTFHTGYFSGSTNLVGTSDIDYNVYYGFDAGSNHAGWGGTLYTDINTYRAAATPNEQNTIFKAVNFVSNTDLHVAGASIGDFDLAGTPITGITDDIDGQPRHATVPYRGGDEGDVPLPVELSTFSASVNGSNVTLEWSTSSEMNNHGFDIERKSVNADWQKVGFVEGAGTTSETRSYLFTDRELVSGIHNYRLKQIDLDGSFTYHNLNNEVEVGIPDKFDLAQNYPNPFNPTTVISYSIAKESLAKLVVFNSIGEEVLTLVNELKQPGNYSYNFDANSLSSGVYFYKLTAGDFVSTRKMLLVK
ncbi:MAG: right-handed parallel beta-helix repeat-containing protein [Ignavibacteriales bacterium]|nr:MAG: right-handed parallel beta-helix repeat-containing protein [Ignavibacteriales bacterium]